MPADTSILPISLFDVARLLVLNQNAVLNAEIQDLEDQAWKLRMEHRDLVFHTAQAIHASVTAQAAEATEMLFRTLGRIMPLSVVVGEAEPDQTHRSFSREWIWDASIVPSLSPSRNQYAHPRDTWTWWEVFNDWTRKDRSAPVEPGTEEWACAQIELMLDEARIRIPARVCITVPDLSKLHALKEELIQLHDRVSPLKERAKNTAQREQQAYGALVQASLDNAGADLSSLLSLPSLRAFNGLG